MLLGFCTHHLSRVAGHRRCDRCACGTRRRSSTSRVVFRCFSRLAVLSALAPVCHGRRFSSVPHAACACASCCACVLSVDVFVLLGGVAPASDEPRR